MIRVVFASGLLLIVAASADEIRVEVDGVGCHTRQLAVQKIWRALPGVTSVEIQPRGASDPANRRVFVINAPQAPGRPALETALGDRTRFYKILTVTPANLSMPVASHSTTHATVRP